MKLIGIYRIVSPTQRVYIGQSWHIKRRWRMHRYRRVSKYSKLTTSLDKYGSKAHSFEAIHLLPPDVSQSVMDTYEQLYMDLYRDAGFYLMNLKEGGARGKLKPEIIKALSERMKGNIPWNKGKKTGPAWNRGIKGVVKMSSETKQKMSKKHMGKQYALGTIRSKEAIEATAAKNKGQKRSEEFKENISTKMKGNNRGVGNKGKVRSEETRKLHSTIQSNRIDNKGEGHNMSKLTNEIVLDIRSKYIPGEYGHYRLAKEFGISKSNAADIVNRKTWRHI